MVAEWVNPGRMGVIIFFAVSGFVIPLSIRKSQDWQDFLVGRLFRLYPAYWISLIVHLLLFALGSNSVNSTANTGIGGWIANFTMLQMFVGVKDINLVAWTLGLEWVIYFAAILIIQLGPRFNPKRFLWISTFALSTVAIVVPLLLQKRVPVAAPQCLIAALFGYATLLMFDQTISKRVLGLYASANLLFQCVSATVNYKLFPKADAEIPFTAILISILAAYVAFYALFAYRTFVSLGSWFGSAKLATASTCSMD